MDNTPNLALPYILPAQAQKHVTHNEAIRALDAIVQLGVVNRQLAGPPAAPQNGACYIVAAAATGAWTGHTGKVAAFQDGAWAFYTPNRGWVAWIIPENALVAWNGTTWIAASVATPINPAPLVGVNTTADATNRLAVKSNSVLLSHDDVTPGSGDLRVVMNKAAAAKTASFLFQTGYSGRAEVGTSGDDKLHVKVSPDGTTWVDAMVVDSNGKIGVGTANPQDGIHLAGVNTSFTVQNTSTAQFNVAGFTLRGPDTLGTAARTAFAHGNQNAGATQAYFTMSYYNQANVWQGNIALYEYGAQRWSLATGNIVRLDIDSAGVKPGADNAVSLGTATRRWSQVWAANGTIQTSDVRDKTEVLAIDAAVAGQLIDAVEPITFKWKIGGQEILAQDQFTGEIQARTKPGKRRHAGFRAQDVKLAMDGVGVDFGAWGIDDPADVESRQWLRPDQLLPVLWAAVRDLRREVAGLRAKG